jgi:hypothetical protein
MKLPSLKAQLWIPSVVSLGMSLLVIGPVFAGFKISDSPGLIAFFCFLPIVFFQVARVTHGYVSHLETRIDHLERRLTRTNG